MSDEVREIFPFTIFRDRPAFGDSPFRTVKKDFRPKVVSADDALPNPVVEEEKKEAGPKAISPATVSVMQLEHGSDETQTTSSNGTPPASPPSPEGEIPVPVAKDTLPTPDAQTPDGNPPPPVVGTGPEQGPIDPPPTQMPSSLLVGKRPKLPSASASDAQ